MSYRLAHSLIFRGIFSMYEADIKLASTVGEGKGGKEKGGDERGRERNPAPSNLVLFLI